MSSGDSGVVVHNEDTYKANRARIQKMQEYIDAANALNEQGKRNFDQMEAELQNKIREGEEAQRMLAALQHAKPLLTYHDSDSQPPSSNFSLPLTNYAPTQTSPGPSARIEEVTDRNHTTEQSSAFYQPNYGQGYQPSQPQTRGRNEHYAPYESNPQYSNQGTQNVPGSSTLHGALGGQTQTHYVASQQTYQSSDPFIFTHYPNFQSGSRPNGASSQQSHAFSQQGVPRASATAQQSNSGAQMQSQPQRSQPYSQQGAFQPGIQPYGSQVPSQIRTGTQSQTRPQSHMGNPHLFGVPSQLNARQSQPTQTPVAAASMQSNPQMQPQRQSYVPQPGGSAQANKQMQIPPAPAQLNVQLRTPSSVAAAQSSSQPHMDALQGAPQASAAASQAAQRPVQTETQPSKATTQPEFVQSAPTPSYGMSPFAHVPTSTVAQAPQKPNPTVVHPQKPNPPAVPPRTDPVMPIQKPKPWNAAESSSSSAPAPVDSSTALVKSSAPKPTLATSANSRFNLFLNLINVWQRASPPTAFMDIPHARVRVTKFPNGEIHFSTADAKTGAEKRLSASVAFSQLAFNGRVQILINPKGIPTLLPEQKLPTTYKPFMGVEVKDAPQATFPDPPSAPAKPHDILRALGKGHVYAADDDRLRYAKRRALEAPEEAPPPPVLQPTLSKEPSAKTTPASSRASSVAPANRVPLFLPHADSSPPPIPVPVSVKMHHPWPSADDSFCVLIPPAPEYVQRHQAKMRREREQEQIAQMETQMEWQEEIPADPQELKRQRARGMKQSLKVCTAEG
ncbi:hypothetical protein C8R43DRAFT_94977 [Mycena crocata]|nr:hypothetical protein C8R43DRAFT_94977 [Mycena crocata]